MVIKSRRDNDIGLFFLEGEKRYHDARVMFLHFIQALNEDGVRAILVFDNSINYLTVSDILDLEQWLSKRAFPRDRKIAVMDSDFREDSNICIGSRIISARGLNLKVFDNEFEAREWLDKHDEDSFCV